MAMLILKKQGWEPIGVSLKLEKWESECNTYSENVCCSEQSFALSRKICDKIGAEYHIYDVGEEFEKEIIDYFGSQLKKGRTPNPCLMCNRKIKYTKLIDWAKKNGIKYVATGHYGQIKKKENKKYALFRASDLSKDQTYGLCMLKQEQLSRMVLPLAPYTKTQVYEMAKKEGFDFFLKTKQSQDLCFVSSKSLRAFIEEKVGKREGVVVDLSGKPLGVHKGLHFFTMGQKCGISGGTAYYVAGFDKEKNLLIATSNRADLMQKEILLENVNFLSGEIPEKEICVDAKIRHGPALEKAILLPLKNNMAKVIFENPAYAPMQGQFCAFYSGDECLGGGEIC